MDYLFLANTMIFQGITPDEIKAMLGCLQAERKTYEKGEIIYRMGDVIPAMGLVLSGRVSIENDDIWGNKSILDTASSGQFFAETYACVPSEPMMVSVVASEKTEVLLLNVSRILQVCSNNCSHHNKIIHNLLSISARKNLNLSRRIFHTSSKSIRGRLLSYLSYQAMKNGSREFDIPFSRQQLADYLSVDRSALSNELSKMQKEGLLSVNRSHFVLLENLEDGI
ncbi:MAG: Crp/Fnr family transcriptional regulator [Anaerotignum sp.]|nr:Crp/Fnr family transcriptional regulator [Anaerotignum sp.]